MKRVAIIGTQGLPAAYGGFETLVENLVGDYTPHDVSFTVFCSRPECPDRFHEYKGAVLKYVPLRSHGIQSILYDILSLLRAVRGYDVILVLGTSGCSFLPIFRLFYHRKLIVNIDGLEHRRDKWGKWARRLLLFSERMAVRHADVIIADNPGICDYVKATYSIDPVMIAYGGDHSVRYVDDDSVQATLQHYGLKDHEYAISICRIEPENNCHLILEAFAKYGKLPLVYVGNWDASEYGRTLKTRYSTCPTVRLIDSVYDLDTLFALRSHARLYVHGHSAGGTNPSLVEAMFVGCPILAYDVVYNRATTHHAARYFSDVDSLISLLDDCDSLDGSALSSIARTHYTWQHIASQYYRLY